eukprot:TRINITY_DN5069_c0_g1_i1.p1 TRINITY_DN5069_c0_g1~~TRINITY_DN5069_c0_g1_i1.p1  ORF type:complete len:389 (-),score=46.46 TRINITY_DN5069_c0_g1_i1:13-1179(-)
MGSRPLRRVLSGDENKETLSLLRQSNIHTCHDLLVAPESDLVNILYLSPRKVRMLIAKTSRAILPPVQTILEISASGSGLAIPTTIKRFDKLMHGGLPLGSITEIVGPAGVGKTQFSLLLTAMTCMSKEDGGIDSGALFLDAESSFRVERLISLIRAKFPKYAEDTPDRLEQLRRYVERVIKFDVESTSQLVNILDNIEGEIIKKGIKLIVIDSIASLARKDFGEGSIVKRQELLSKVASILKRLAENCKLSVLLVNQITSKRDPAVRFDFAKGGATNVFQSPTSASTTTAALGTLWRHAVNSGLVLEYAKQANEGVRLLSIAKSPLAPVTTFGVCIFEGGMRDATDSEVDLEEFSNTPNFWDRSISTRSSAAPGLNTFDTNRNTIIY